MRALITTSSVHCGHCGHLIMFRPNALFCRDLCTLFGPPLGLEVWGRSDIKLDVELPIIIAVVLYTLLLLKEPLS